MRLLFLILLVILNLAALSETGGFKDPLRLRNQFGIPAEAQTFKSEQYTIQTGITRLPITPTPFEPKVLSGFQDSTGGKPMRLTVSSNLIGYGVINATNPIKRKFNVSLDPGTAQDILLYVFENHPLSICHPDQGDSRVEGSPREFTPRGSLSTDSGAGDSSTPQPNGRVARNEDCVNIPDTTCDDGNCTESKASIWVNPFTFGLGYSFDDNNYRQFADSSKDEPITTIPAAEMLVKLNASQNQTLAPEKYYENSIIFLAIPKY